MHLSECVLRHVTRTRTEKVPANKPSQKEPRVFNPCLQLLSHFSGESCSLQGGFLYKSINLRCFHQTYAIVNHAIQHSYMGQHGTLTNSISSRRKAGKPDPCHVSSCQKSSVEKPRRKHPQEQGCLCVRVSQVVCMRLCLFFSLLAACLLACSFVCLPLLDGLTDSHVYWLISWLSDWLICVCWQVVKKLKL